MTNLERRILKLEERVSSESREFSSPKEGAYERDTAQELIMHSLATSSIQLNHLYEDLKRTKRRRTEWISDTSKLDKIIKVLQDTKFDMIQFKEDFE